jgi:integrase
MVMGKLNHRKITSLPDGRHADGNGLCLNVAGDGAHRSYVFRYRWQGKQREIGLGSADKVKLAEARDKALDFHVMLKRGQDPKATPTTGRTFGDCAKAYILAHRSEWTNHKHALQWETGFQRLCPSLMPMPVDAIDTEAVLGVLAPLWGSTRETANRLRGRIELVLGYAKSRGYRSGENPAMWRGHLKNLLAAAPKAKAHMPALPYKDLPALMARIRALGTEVALALEFSILTASRAGNVVNARWDQMKDGLWIIPANEMKAAVEHRVPLVGRALEIIGHMASVRSCEHVFAGRFMGQTFGVNALNECLQKRLGVTNATQHGMRSTFRDWAGDCTSFPREIAEAALAHTVGSDVERAYRRGDALEKRRELMAAWGKYCCGADNVVAIRKHA